MRFGHSYPPPGLQRFSNVHSVLSSLGALKAINHTSGGRYQNSPADGDRLLLDFFCDGSETLLELSTYKVTNCGIWDLYVNGSLDSSSYDDYAAAGASVHREITLSVPVVAGRNTLELRVNGKNVASTSYVVMVTGASLQ